MINEKALLKALSTFGNNVPFDHCVIDNFFQKKVALQLENEFPNFQKTLNFGKTQTSNLQSISQKTLKMQRFFPQTFEYSKFFGKNFENLKFWFFQNSMIFGNLEIT